MAPAGVAPDGDWSPPISAAEAGVGREAKEKAQRPSVRRFRKPAMVLAAVALIGAALTAYFMTVEGNDERRDRTPPAGGASSSDDAPQRDAQSVESALRPLEGLTQVGSILGEDEAVARLTIYADITSPVFARFDRRFLPRLIRRHVRGGELSMQIRTVPSGPASLLASQYAQAAGLQTRFWDFVRAFSAAPGAGADVVAESVPDLDDAQLSKDSATGRVTDAIDKARRIAEDAGVERYPTYTLDTGDGERVIGMGRATPQLLDRVESGLRTER